MSSHDAGVPADGAAPVPRRRPSAVPAAVGVAAALLALSTLGLTWVSRTVEGPLGDAGAAQVEQLSGRDVAPLVAALVPGVAAVVVVALLLRGWWRAGALVLAALGAGAAALSAGVLVLGDEPDGSTTAVPLVATLACLLVAGCAVTGAVGAARGARAGAGSAAPASPPPRPAPDPTPADLWRELDEGRDPTGTA